MQTKYKFSEQTLSQLKTSMVAGKDCFVLYFTRCLINSNFLKGYNQRWLTSAGDDEEGWKCILLARSIQRTLTTRQIGIFISDKVTDDMRY